MKLYNSLTRELEKFAPTNPAKVSVYTCGPTVYDYVTIGNWRTYVLGDLAVRAFKYLGHEVDYVMNITDVGHLTGDNEGDASTGEDRQEKAAKREGKSAQELAQFYADDFQKGFEKLNLLWPKTNTKGKRFTWATDYIDEQIDLVKRIEEAGFAYKIQDGIYFDILAYEAAGHEYGRLTTIDQVKAGARVEPNPEKRDPRDFALWKFSEKPGERQMEWESPWGLGFPGWHAECSAMILTELGEQIDVHVGGEDLKSTHHPNEIAQSEAVTGKEPFVKYWLHGAFLQVDGGRMGKSLGNAYTLQDVEERGFSPMDLKYFYLTGHYRKQLNFTWEGLGAAQQALKNLKSRGQKIRLKAAASRGIDGSSWEQQFKEALESDLNAPQALAVVWEMVKDEAVSAEEKLRYLKEWSEVLGLDLTTESVPDKVLQMMEERESLRAEQQYEEADAIRDKIVAKGFALEDTEDGSLVYPS